LAFGGKPKWQRDHWQISNPRVRILDGANDPKDSGIVPVYPLTEDLRAEQLRAIIRQAVENYGDQVREILPADIRESQKLPPASLALRQVHFPESLPSAAGARRRFVYEEFLILQLALASRRRELRDRQQAPPLPVTAAIDGRIRRLFPFRATADQDTAIAEICKDMAGKRPMQRLLQADVGAGKTMVAVYALLVAVANKHQAAFIAPTEVLARQHWQTLEGYLVKSRVRRLLLTGDMTKKERRAAAAAIGTGEIDLVVGTQALLQEDIQFTRMGLVVIDEQHKFGVNQRARVRQMGIDPHYLVMTATPIPRTMALTVFGDLNVSTIRQLPPGRQPVTTRCVPASRREWVYEQVREGLRRGRQGYVVCPLVSSSEGSDRKAADRTHAELQSGPFREFRVGLLHGQLDGRTRDRAMDQFREGKLDLLVSTTVVEVGVDVPNASLLLVEHAERFGLAQLHQLRGRIGRGKVPGECYLFANPASDEAKERLRLVTQVADGFVLAEHDARLRGLGEFFGTRQHGLGELRLADLVADRDLLNLARKDAFDLVGADPGLRLPQNALIREAMLARYGKTLQLAEIG